MISGLFSAAYWAMGSGVIFGVLGLVVVIYLGPRWTKAVVIAGLVAVALSALTGFYRAGVRHGGAKITKTYDKVLSRRAKTARKAERAMKASKQSASGSLAAQIKQIRQKGVTERSWMDGHTVPDRLTPEALTVLGQ